MTIDCSALCLKSGNAIVLRGSSMAAHSNAVLAQVASARGRRRRACPQAAISLVAGGDRDELRQLATQDGVVDLIIPRGGEGLKAALKEHATVPVMYAAAGNCHVYVDATADLDDALAIVRQRQGAAARACATRRRRCSCTPTWRPSSCRARCGELRESGVELRVDGRARAAGGRRWPTRSARRPRRTGPPSTTR